MRKELWFCCGLLVSAAALADTPADVVIVGAKIMDIHNERVFHSALAMDDGRIAYVGDEQGVGRWIGPSTKIHKLPGKLVSPGFIESHGHFLDTGLLKLRLDLHGTTSEDQVLSLVSKALKNTAPGKWLVGDGWDQNLWPAGQREFPNAERLSKISSKHPVVLYRVDGHALWANAKAMALAKITMDTPDPQGGKILRFANGKPSGIFIDHAMGLIDSKVPAPTRAQKLKAFTLAEQAALSSGVTTFHDAGVDDKTIELYEQNLQEPDHHLRFYLMLDGSDRKLLGKYFTLGQRVGLYRHHLTIRAVKAYADGALGSRGAALEEPYSDDNSHSGLLLTNVKELAELAELCLKHGYQLATHAIGDKANHVVLDAYEQAMQSVISKVPPRFRIEHAQIIAPEDVARFGKLNVIASMQPTHATSDMPWVPARLGEKRTLERAYLWRSLIASGARIAAGSDTPVESGNPLLGIYALVTRQDVNGQPASGWNPMQKLSRFEAVQLYTINGAYAGFQERDLGSLDVGKLADVIVLDKDILAVPEPEILTTKVLLTFIGGKLVYSHEQNLRTKK